MVLQSAKHASHNSANAEHVLHPWLDGVPLQGTEAKDKCLHKRPSKRSCIPCRRQVLMCQRTCEVQVSLRCGGNGWGSTTMHGFAWSDHEWKGQPPRHAVHSTAGIPNQDWAQFRAAAVSTTAAHQAVGAGTWCFRVSQRQHERENEPGGLVVALVVALAVVLGPAVVVANLTCKGTCTRARWRSRRTSC